MSLLSAQRTQIMAVIKREGVVPVDALVGRLELSKTAVRAHLLTLEEQGFIERAEIEIDGARVGRPPLAFRVTDRAQSLFPSRDPELLTRLLQFLGERGHRDIVHAFFERVWADRRSEYEAELAARCEAEQRLPDRLAALEAILERQHFMPRIELIAANDPGPPGARRRVVVNERNCPFGAAVRASLAPCRLESEFLSAVIGSRPASVTLATSHSSSCVFTFEVGPEADRGA